MFLKRYQTICCEKSYHYTDSLNLNNLLQRVRLKDQSNKFGKQDLLKWIKRCLLRNLNILRHISPVLLPMKCQVKIFFTLFPTLLA